MYSPTCPSISESRHIQPVAVRLPIDGERGVTSKHFVSIKIFHVDHQLVPFSLRQVEDIFQTWRES